MTMTRALIDVIAERTRQMTVEGLTPEHDDVHSDGEIARAAECYAHVGSSGAFSKLAKSDKDQFGVVPNNWPWDDKWWKPKDKRSNLVRAAALLIAEIERIDRNEKPTIAAIRIGRSDLAH